MPYQSLKLYLDQDIDQKWEEEEEEKEGNNR